jgi:hypothetical protein
LSSSLDTIEACGGGSADAWWLKFSCQKIIKRRIGLNLSFFYFFYIEIPFYYIDNCTQYIVFLSQLQWILQFLKSL